VSLVRTPKSTSAWGAKGDINGVMPC
jgi:hypothetical protein